jgi:hypothetical protein
MKYKVAERTSSMRLPAERKVTVGPGDQQPDRAVAPG